MKILKDYVFFLFLLGFDRGMGILVSKFSKSYRNSKPYMQKGFSTN